MFIGLIVIVGIVIYFLYNNKGITTQFSTRKSAEETLKERFVNGEIDEETFKKMKDTLNR